MAHRFKAWLRMHDTAGTYPFEKSDEMWSRYKHLYYACHPLNGGEIQADGSLTEDTERVDHGFAYGLKRSAQDLGVLYMPTVRANAGADMDTVLQSAALRTTAVDNIVLWATGTTTTGRFDSPWDGVDLNIEGASVAYKAQMSLFIQELYAALNAADCLLNVTAYAIEADTAGIMTANHYVFDYAVLAEYADSVTMMNYSHGNRTPNIPGPYEWVEEASLYALGKGVLPENLYIGLINYCQYYDGAANNECSYTQGKGLWEAGSATPAWYEDSGNDQVYRWKYASWDTKQIWVMDEDTWRVHLEIPDRYGLAGACMFVPGNHVYGEDVGIYQVVDEWQKRALWSGYSPRRNRADIRQRIMERFGGYRRLVADSGTTTTVVSKDLFEPDSHWAGYWLHCLRDAEFAGRYPEGQTRRVTSYTQSTQTLTTDLAFKAVAALEYPTQGDLFELYPSHMPPAELNTLIEEALKHAAAHWFKEVWDETTLDFASGTWRYTLPTDVQRLRGVYIRGSDSYRWKDFKNWEVVGTPGGQYLKVSAYTGADEMALHYEAMLDWDTTVATDASVLNIAGTEHLFEQYAIEYIVEWVLEKMYLKMMNQGDSDHRNHYWNQARLAMRRREDVARKHAMPRLRGQVTRAGWQPHDVPLRRSGYGGGNNRGTSISESQ